jgi:hypothetical protein
MKSYLLKLFFAVLFISLNASAQVQFTTHNILLKSGTVRTQNNFTEKIMEAIPVADIFNGYYYRLLQFEYLPSESEKQSLEATGVKLLGYIPYNTFYAAIPEHYELQNLSSYHVRTLLHISTVDKLSKQLLIGYMPDYAKRVSGKVDIMVQYFATVSADVAIKELQSRGCMLLNKIDETQLLTVRMDVNAWGGIAELPFVKYIQPVAPDPVPEDTKGRSLHRSNTINSDYPMGRHYDGSGVSVALADDGLVGPHIDFTGRMTNMLSTNAGHHGDMTSGICVGAGNLDPTIRGMGTGAYLYVFDIGPNPVDTTIGSYAHILQAAQNLATLGTVVISTSYRTGCNEYDVYAELTDRIMHTLQIVEPVWSGGNGNGVDCGYGAGAYWGNITGGFKQGKNVISVANLDEYEVLVSSSSIGPASDGRIKPDISSNGGQQMSTDQDNSSQVGSGTSAACPGIAGVCSQLYQAYRILTGQANPDAALIKGCLQNSAEDIGNAGPDFKHGYGRVNALRAVKTLEQNHYFTDSVLTGNTKTFSIAVPSGAKRLKVMTIWNDVEGSSVAAIALVNDLNMTVTDPSTTVYNPWVLDPTPNAITLDYPAVRGIDNLNNMEQVTIDNPTAGNYTVNVSGFSVPVGIQKFFVVYEVIDDSITVTYPIGGEGFVPNETEVLRWDAVKEAGTFFSLNYSTDNGSSWINITNSAAGDVLQYDWTIPATVNGQTFVRVSRAGISDMNDAPVSIIDTTGNIEMLWRCADSLKLSWDVVPGAIAYEIYKLGAMYMDPIGTSTTNDFVVTNISANDTAWFSVAAVAPNNGKGRRAIAVEEFPGMFNCSMALDMAVTSISPPSGTMFACSPLNAVSVIANLSNFGFNTATSFNVYYSLNGATPVMEPFTGNLGFGASMIFYFATTVDLSSGGTFTLQVWVSYVGDMNALNDTIVSTIIVGTTATIPVTEDFQAVVFPPSGWSVIASGGAYTWEKSVSITGSSGTATTAAFVNDYDYSTVGAEEGLSSMLLDLTTTSAPIMTFDVAYKPYNASYQDALRIDISTDCGATFVPTGYYKAYLDLGTTTPGTSVFFPSSAAQWRNDTVVLIPWAGTNAIVKFVNINAYGNNLFIDNINLENNLQVGINPVDVSGLKFEVYPNPANDYIGLWIRQGSDKFSDFGTGTIEIYNSIGERIYFSEEKNVNGNFTKEISLKDFASGIYLLNVTADRQTCSRTFIKE